MNIEQIVQSLSNFHEKNIFAHFRHGRDLYTYVYNYEQLRDGNPILLTFDISYENSNHPNIHPLTSEDILNYLSHFDDHQMEVFVKGPQPKLEELFCEIISIQETNGNPLLILKPHINLDLTNLSM